LHKKKTPNHIRGRERENLEKENEEVGGGGRHKRGTSQPKEKGLYYRGEKKERGEIMTFKRNGIRLHNTKSRAPRKTDSPI